MLYRFFCEHCNNNDIEIDIPMSDYDKLKEMQICPECNRKIKRFIEWNGIAEGNGSGWFGKSDGSKTI